MAKIPETMATTEAKALKYGCTLAIDIIANEPLRPVKFIPVFCSILVFQSWYCNRFVNMAFDSLVRICC